MVFYTIKYSIKYPEIDKCILFYVLHQDDEDGKALARKIRFSDQDLLLDRANTSLSRMDHADTPFSRLGNYSRADTPRDIQLMVDEKDGKTSQAAYNFAY